MASPPIDCPTRTTRSAPVATRTSRMATPSAAPCFTTPASLLSDRPAPRSAYGAERPGGRVGDGLEVDEEQPRVEGLRAPVAGEHGRPVRDPPRGDDLGHDDVGGRVREHARVEVGVDGVGAAVAVGRQGGRHVAPREVGVRQAVDEDDRVARPALGERGRGGEEQGEGGETHGRGGVAGLNGPPRPRLPGAPPYAPSTSSRTRSSAAS